VFESVSLKTPISSKPRKMWDVSEKLMKIEGSTLNQLRALNKTASGQTTIFRAKSVPSKCDERRNQQTVQICNNSSSSNKNRVFFEKSSRNQRVFGLCKNGSSPKRLLEFNKPLSHEIAFKQTCLPRKSSSHQVPILWTVPTSSSPHQMPSLDRSRAFISPPSANSLDRSVPPCLHLTSPPNANSLDRSVFML